MSFCLVRIVKFNIFFAALVFGVLGQSVFAQSFTGVANSEYAVLNQLYLNPANIVNGKNKTEIQLFQTDVSVFNNYYTFNPIWNVPFSPFFLSQNDSTHFGRYKGMATDRYPEITSPVNFGYALDLRLLGYYRQFTSPTKKTSSIAITTRSRTLNNLNNVDRNLFQLVETNNVNDRIVDQLKNYVFSINNLQYSLHKFAEIGVTYGRELIKKQNYILSAGVTAKRLLGIYHEGFTTENLYARFQAPPRFNDYTLILKNGIDFNISNQNKLTGINAIFPVANIFSNSAAGWGGDLGFSMAVYKKKKETPSTQISSLSEADQKAVDSAKKSIFLIDCYTKYKFKISASIIDFGYVKYAADVTENHKIQIVDSAKYNSWNNNVVGNTNAFRGFLNAMISDNIQYIPNGNDGVTKNYQQAVNVYLPAKFHVDIDFPVTLKRRSGILKYTYVNLAYNHNLFNAYSLLQKGALYGNQILSHVVASLRYQTRDLDISIPITTFTTLIPAMPLFNIGIATRYKQFTIGTNNIASILSVPYTNTLNIFAGVHFAVPYVCPPPPSEDTATEEVKNGYRYKDIDNDKIPDNKDKCPTIFGDISNYGCPIDRDTLLNKQIVELAGKLKFIVDKDVLQPSSDIVLDSIRNLLNAFPNARLIFSGKPDSSHLAYHFNQQLALNRDSVLREEIFARGIDSSRVVFVPIRPEQPMLGHIPIIRKVIEGKDEDRDGVYDTLDRCPSLVGSSKDEGCTFVDSTDNSLATLALGSKIEFWKGLKNFAYSSEQHLDEVAKIMLASPDERLLVRGFVGREILTLDYKYELAQQRADTIKRYLVSKGVQPHRIIALGMSPYEPYNSVPLIFSLGGREGVDLDFDKMPDTIDRCPTLKGTVEADGCPSKEELEKLRYLDSLSQEIKFEPDTDAFATESIPALLKLYAFLMQHPDQTVALSPGVISSTLNNEQKDQLSQMRAFKLKNYLESLGVNSDRLIARGLGYQQPLSAINTVMPINSRLMDIDLDDVKDYEDRCPTVQGSVSNYGCPQVNDESSDLLARINRNLIFDPNTSRITPESVLYLDSLLLFMAYNPNITIVTSGNVANPALAPQLQDKINQARADVIRNYLIVNGVSKNRVTAVGLSHLEQKPWLIPSARVVDNLTDIDADLTREVYDKCPNTIGSTFNYGCPYQLDKINNKLKEISANLLFDFDKTDLKPKAQLALKELRTLLQNDTTIVLIVSGHADTLGTRAYNEVISLKRAQTTKEFIVNNTAIKPERFMVLGLGDKFPIADNKTVHGREENRRVSIFLLE